MREWWVRLRRLMGLVEAGVAVCPRCRREVTAGAKWMCWGGEVWHLGCLAQARGWRVEEGSGAVEYRREC